MSQALTLEGVNELFQTEQMHLTQRQFATTRAKFPLAIGAQGSGKSRALIQRALFLSIDTPYFGSLAGNRGIIGRFSRTDLVDTTMADFLEFVPEDWIAHYPAKPTYECRLINGSVIQFVPLEDIWRFKSRNLGWAGIEEVDEIDEAVWEEIAFNRLRRVKTSTGGVVSYHTAFGCCNPTKNWVFDIWGLNEEKLESKNEEERKSYDPDLLVIHSSTYDNRENLPPGFIERREKHFGGADSVRGKMYLLGQWGSGELDVYPWRDELVNDRDKWPPLEFPTIIGLDHGWGADGVTAFDFLALERLEIGRTKVHVYDEIDLENVDIATAVEALDDAIQFHAVKRAEASGLPVAPSRLPKLIVLFDPAMKAQVQRTDKAQKELSVIEVYQQRCVERHMKVGFIPGNNKILPGVDRMTWLMQNGLIDWNPRCVNSRRQHKNLVWDMHKSDEIKSGQKRHHPDATRYAVMFLDTLYHFPQEKAEPTLIERIKQKKEKQRKERLIDLGVLT